MALGELQTTLARAGKQKQAAAAAFAAASAAVLLHLPMPEEMPPVGDFLPLLPPGLRTFALYVQAHYLYPKEEYALSAGMVEGGHWPWARSSTPFRRFICIWWRLWTT